MQQLENRKDATSDPMADACRPSSQRHPPVLQPPQRQRFAIRPPTLDDDVNGGIRRPFEDDNGDWRYFSSRGWLISVTQFGLNVTLVDPFSGLEIRTPCVPEDILDYNGFHKVDWEYIPMISKFALSSSPNSVSESYALTVGMIFPMCRTLAFWRRGEDKWTWLPRQEFASFMDMNFCNGQFYGLDEAGRVVAFGNEVGITKPPAPRLVASLNWPYTSPGQSYLVESSSDNTLLVVHREPEWIDNEDDFLNFSEDHRYWTALFKVWEVDIDSGEANELESLGNRALFVGLNSSFSLDASTVRGCKLNCIYYIDNLVQLFVNSPLKGGTDMGVYDLALGKKIQDFYDGPFRLSETTPPLWVEPPSNPLS